MDGTLQKRNPRRKRVLLKASLDSAAGRQDVRIRDLSIKGALLEAATPPPEGSEITLSAGDTSLKGKVAWHDDLLVGIEFTEALSGSLLASAQAEKLELSVPRNYRHNRLPPAETRTKASNRVINLRDR